MIELQHLTSPILKGIRLLICAAAIIYGVSVLTSVSHGYYIPWWPALVLPLAYVALAWEMRLELTSHHVNVVFAHALASSINFTTRHSPSSGNTKMSRLKKEPLGFGYVIWSMVDEHNEEWPFLVAGDN
ncbi:hypothetical protein ACNUDM_17135 [Vibrio chaetopteri]|uniref:hypothetical protein n=1 Tax=Vibrio chaetopteri TaxID=3016528 RepID=UPI003AB177E8